ncbi:MAG TPA: integrase, partial [Cycloclasticus sp.]|nr:integrase [Cycloclasticus sp.]
MSNRIDTISGRKKLSARTEPYWYKLSMGQYLGFRKLADGS